MKLFIEREEQTSKEVVSLRPGILSRRKEGQHSCRTWLEQQRMPALRWFQGGNRSHRSIWLLLPMGGVEGGLRWG